ncbi:hypothetical protein WMY93_021894 [Mugilogobius chulae]|uniref:Nuclear pore complex protein Nup214 phenylalanine-glycine (FG) domain-containing protein n=1 Tax=Mugilogobius chulae TaxID=88201 RepID=A0AAW0NLZ9_9GOBI
MAPSAPAPKPPVVLAPVCPVPTSTPAPAVQKPTPAPQPLPHTPQGAVTVKSLEKLQQKKDSHPIMAGILEEIAHFQKELDDLKARSAKGDFKVGTNDEMKELRKESENMHVFTLEIKETTESLHGDIGMLKTNLLEGFAGAEEAKAQSELSKDRNYRHLLYKRPLDPRSDEQLKEIRRLYQYALFAVDDVNDVLDVEWEKHLEKKKQLKHMVVPGRESLFTTLSNNQYIINHMDGELENLRDALLKAKIESSPKESPKAPAAKISPVKQSQLRNFLSKGQMPPVRSTAPANLSRSAFLSPKYYEDLDDVSSTSSLSQSLDPNPRHLELEEEEEEEELQQAALPVLPPSLSTPRHPTVVRTPSIQPGFGAIQSTPFAKLQSLQSMGFGLSPIPSPVPTAGTAALRRQMAIQKPAASSPTLTESTLKTVPHVVNVQELKDNGRVPPVIGSSASNSAAQVVQQVLTTVPSNQVKRLPSQVSQKIPTESAASSQSGFVFGMPSTTTAAEQNNSKGFSFSSSSTPFSFTSVALGTGNSQVKDSTVKFQFGNGKSVFGQTSEEQFSLTPKSTSPAPSASVETTNHLPPSGDTLGVFTDIRLGQGEAKDTPSKPAFSFCESGLETGKAPSQFSFGAAVQTTSEEPTGTEQPKDSLFKPPDSTTKQSFSLPQLSSAPLVVGLLSTPSSTDTSDDSKAPAPVSEPTEPPEYPAQALNWSPTGQEQQVAAPIALVPTNTVPSPPPPAAEAPQTSASPAPEPPAAALPPSGPAPVSAAQITPPQVTSSDTPGSIFTQPLPATTDSTTVVASPVINTVAMTATTPPLLHWIFGQSTAAPVFGQSSAFGQAPVFGSNTTTSSSSGFSFVQPSAVFLWWWPVWLHSGSTGGSSGGGFFSGLGGKPSEDAANKNPFGAAAATGAFGQPAQSGNNNLFGNSGAKGFSFGQSAFGDQKSSGTFSAGSGSVAAQGFGSFSSPTKPGGFGSAPVFGSPPSFGGSPAFGSGASFGTTPSFSSPLGSSAGKVFGEGTAASSMGGFGFGSTSNAPTFGALANQSAPSFGGLSQQGSTFGSQPSGFSGFGQQQQQQQHSSGFGSGNAFGSSNQSNSTFSGWRS